MTTRAKFKVDSVTNYGYGTAVAFYPVGYGNSEENKAFWDATPAGKIEMTITTDAAAQFQPGQEFYVDFTPADAPALDVQDCASCGNDHEAVPANATSTAGGTFECPDSKQPVSYTNDEAQPSAPDPRNTI